MRSEIIQYGFQSAHEAVRLREVSPQIGLTELTSNLSTYLDHGLTDTPVSKSYRYELTSDGIQRPVLPDGTIAPPIETDMSQRGGITHLGAQAVFRSLSECDAGRVVLQYSPIGPASFETTHAGDYDGGYYHEGQLYVYKKNDTGVVEATAITVTQESIIKRILSDFGLTHPVNLSPKGEEFISYYTLNPVSTNLTVGEFTNVLEESPLSWAVLHTDKHGREYNLSQVARLIRAAFGGTLKSEGDERATELVERFVAKKGTTSLTKDHIRELYLTAVYEYGKRQGWSEVDIATACGGARHSMNALLDALTALSGQNSIITPNMPLYRDMQSSLRPNKDTRFTTCPQCGSEVRFSASAAIEKSYLACNSCGNFTTCPEPIVAVSSQFSKAA